MNLNWLFSIKKPVQMKMYVLVLNCLEDKYKIIQGSHALSKFSIEHRITFNVWNNETIVYLGVRTPIELMQWRDKLLFKKKLISCFREPDLFNMLTGIACYDDGKIFKSLKLA
jgi:hypothetical protein